MLVVVLNDGSTFTNLEGCRILWIKNDDDAVTETVEEMVKEGQGFELTPENVQHLLPHHVRQAENI